MNGSNFARAKTNRSYDFIPPENAPVRSAKRRPQRPAEIVDAEFEVIDSPLRAHYRILNDNHARGRQNVETAHWSVVLFCAFVLTAEKFLANLGQRGFAGLVGACAVLVFSIVFLISGGEADVAADAPGPLAISRVGTSVIDSNGLRIIEVRGQVENVSGNEVDVPALSAQIEAVEESPSITVFRLEEPKLTAGQSVPFSLKLPHPGGKLPQVSVSVDAGAF